MSATPEERLLMAIIQSGCIRCECAFEDGEDTTVVTGLRLHTACLTDDDKLFRDMSHVRLRDVLTEGQMNGEFSQERGDA
jgi:hypothetical protein